MIQSRMVMVLGLVLCGVVGRTEDDPMPHFVAMLPWGEQSAMFPKDGDSPDLTVTISYRKEGVVSDRDVFPFKFYPSGNGYRGKGHGCKRDGMKSWCNGGAFVRHPLGREGFRVEVHLLWGMASEPRVRHEFNETFDCRWVSRQEFRKGGFEITVEVSGRGFKRPAAARSLQGPCGVDLDDLRILSAGVTAAG